MADYTPATFADDDGVVRLSGTLSADIGGSQPIQMVTKTLTAADLLDLHNTPVEILPAPGGRFYYVIHEIVLHYRFATTPYTAAVLDDAFLIFYGTEAADFAEGQAVYWWGQTLGSFAATDLLTLEEDAYVYGARPTPGSTLTSNSGDWQMWKASAIENKVLSVANAGDPFVDGDSELSIRLFYSNIDGAPAA